MVCSFSSFCLHSQLKSVIFRVSLYVAKTILAFSYKGANLSTSPNSSMIFISYMPNFKLFLNHIFHHFQFLTCNLTSTTRMCSNWILWLKIHFIFPIFYHSPVHVPVCSISDGLVLGNTRFVDSTICQGTKSWSYIKGFYQSCILQTKTYSTLNYSALYHTISAENVNMLLISNYLYALIFCSVFI